MHRVPTALLAAATLILSWGVVEVSGSRPLGGIVLAAGGIGCIAIWARRDGPRTAALLGACGLLSFAVSHVIALALGPWPSVLIVAAAMGALAWLKSDAPAGRAGAAFSA
ncbi:MAG: hypothetical protein ACYCU0_07065 [Solirubrobacteraceae bacterium]